MKIFCVGRNYVAHIQELENEIPAAPVIFMKADTAVNKDPHKAPYPSFTENYQNEGEIVIKIAREGKNIPVEKARAYFDEWTVGIDFTARDVQTKLKAKSLPWELAKSFDGSASLGEWVPVPAGPLNQTDFQIFYNKQLIQDGHTEKMIYSFEYLVSFVSRYFTLCPGDIIFTGTPAGVTQVFRGDRLEGYLNGEKLLDVTII